jgi:hypothetical protein
MSPLTHCTHVDHALANDSNTAGQTIYAWALDAQEDWEDGLAHSEDFNECAICGLTLEVSERSMMCRRGDPLLLSELCLACVATTHTGRGRRCGHPAR